MIIMESSKRNVAKMEEDSVLAGRVKGNEHASNNVNAVKRRWIPDRRRDYQPRERAIINLVKNNLRTRNSQKASMV